MHDASRVVIIVNPLPAGIGRTLFIRRTVDPVLLVP
jgi:hypothetical protein